MSRGHAHKWRIPPARYWECTAVLKSNPDRMCLCRAAVGCAVRRRFTDGKLRECGEARCKRHRQRGHDTGGG